MDRQNFHILHYRKVDGFLVTAKNSGTHWLRFMLSHAFAEQFGHPPPARSSGPDSDDYIGHPRKGPRWPGTPRIGSSHNIPSRLLASPFVRRLAPLPPTVVLVRDPYEALQSFWSKWADHYGGTAEEFAHGDPSGRRYKADVWWFLHFFNRWGACAERFPDNVQVLRYEDLQKDPRAGVAAAARWWGVELTDAALDKAVAAGSRGAVSAALDAQGAERGVVSDPAERAARRFSAEHLRVLEETLSRHLRHDFGYGVVGRERLAEAA
jgi:hypothetical protein